MLSIYFSIYTAATADLDLNFKLIGSHFYPHVLGSDFGGLAIYAA